jgi:hypothetical protein
MPVPKHVVLIVVMNYILLGVFYGVSIDCENMHGMYNINVNNNNNNNNNKKKKNLIHLLLVAC